MCLSLIADLKALGLTEITKYVIFRKGFGKWNFGLFSRVL
jgi:hypothetical protein